MKHTHYLPLVGRSESEAIRVGDGVCVYGGPPPENPSLRSEFVDLPTRGR
jgi:hypothetical protein